MKDNIKKRTFKYIGIRLRDNELVVAAYYKSGYDSGPPKVAHYNEDQLRQYCMASTEPDKKIRKALGVLERANQRVNKEGDIILAEAYAKFERHQQTKRKNYPLFSEEPFKDGCSLATVLPKTRKAAPTELALT